MAFLEELSERIDAADTEEDKLVALLELAICAISKAPKTTDYLLGLLTLAIEAANEQPTDN